jgi:pilus assembly protein Flp/PilA
MVYRPDAALFCHFKPNWRTLSTGPSRVCGGWGSGTVQETVMAKFLKLLKAEHGATAIEYGLIAALIAVAAIGAMKGIGTKMNTMYTNVSTNL